MQITNPSIPNFVFRSFINDFWWFIYLSCSYSWYFTEYRRIFTQYSPKFCDRSSLRSSKWIVSFNNNRIDLQPYSLLSVLMKRKWNKQKHDFVFYMLLIYKNYQFRRTSLCRASYYQKSHCNHPYVIHPNPSFQN